MALCEMQWVVEFHFSTKEVNHVDEVFDIMEASGMFFGGQNRKNPALVHFGAAMRLKRHPSAFYGAQVKAIHPA